MSHNYQATSAADPDNEFSIDQIPQTRPRDSAFAWKVSTALMTTIAAGALIALMVTAGNSGHDSNNSYQPTTSLAAEPACHYTGLPRDPDTGGCPFGHSIDTNLDALPTHLTADPDVGQKTAQGCECKTACGATIDDAFTCDWCHTADGCGKHSFVGLGWYDYCVYPDDPSFEAKTFEEKNTFFWGMITQDKLGATKYPSVSRMLTEDVQTSFWNFKDTMPAGRVKGIHGIGAVCQFKLDVAADSPYTGLFAGGPQLGFVRMGGALSWDKESKGFPPGLGIKFARTGMPSGGYVGLVSLDEAIFNFMGKNFSNHIGPAGGIKPKILVKKFNEASQCPSQVGLSNMAEYSQDGLKVTEPKTPFKLYLVPSQEVQRSNDPKEISDVMSELESFKKGTSLMDVWACGKGLGDAENKPTTGGVEKACGDPFKLGSMVTTTECTRTAWGDAKFFFRHQPIEEDWEKNPEFLTQFDAKTACGASKSPTVGGIPKSCADKKH